MATKQPDRSVSGTPVAVLLLVVLIGAGVYKWWPSDERAIRRQLDALADTLTVPSTDTELSRVTRLAELRECFAPDVQIHFENQELASRDALLAFVERWTPAPGRIFVEFVDVKVTLGGDDTATVYLTAKVTSAKEGPAADSPDRDARAPSAGHTIIDAREVNLTMAKQNDDWVITKVESQETLEKPSRP